MEVIEAAGVAIAFEQRGHGPPLVLLHGIPSDGRVWRRQLDDLSDEFRVVAWDAPGCGRSGDPDGPFGLTDAARCLVEFVAALGLERPHVLGLSWGGGLALEVYRIEPSLPRSLVLAGTYAGWKGSLPPDDVAARLGAYLTAARTSDRDLKSFGPGMFSPSAPPELVDELTEIASSSVHHDALASLARSFAETDLRPVLPTIAVPTLVLHGDADARSPLAVGEALHAAIPGSQFVVLPGVGHVSNVEAPDQFDRAVRDFLRSVPG
jgi:pimeloyl-ACP methyl ester carboxylesterase